LKYERFFCKYACPLGAVIGIIGKLGLAKIVREDDGCKGCNICQKKCFAHIDFLSTRTISDAECNHCLDCVSFCPKPNVLALRGAGWNLSTPVYASLLVAGLFATIGVSQLSGKWRTKPEMVAFTDKAGKPDAGQIRGWMSLEEVSAGYGIPLRELYQLSGLPEQVEGTTRLNQVASRYGLNFEPDALRETVERYLEKPQAGPATKAEMQEARQAPVVPHKATPAPRASKAMAGSGDGVKHEPAQHGQQPGNKDHPGGEQEIRGMMTLNEVVLKTGVPKDFIMRKLAINGEVDARIPLREWMHDKGKSIADVRDAVAEFRAGRN
jgi:Pyruvate/2-oxoacid:ferredoxin oxidoreductase delta subunit